MWRHYAPAAAKAPARVHAFVWSWPRLRISLRKRQGQAMSVLVQHEERPEGGRVARLTIDNAGKLNSLNRALMAEIIETAGKLATDPQLRLLVLTGTGERAFVGGADIAEIAALD